MQKISIDSAGRPAAASLQPGSAARHLAANAGNVMLTAELTTLNRVGLPVLSISGLLVPAYSDISLLSEFEHVKQWAADNKLIINISKTKELVFQRPSLKHFLAPVVSSKYPVQSYWELSLRIILVLMNSCS